MVKLAGVQEFSGTMRSETTEVVVVGGGPAGLTAAVAVAAAGIPTVLIAAKPRPDNRTTALHRGAITALETLGVWERCRADAAALRVMRIVDDTSRLLRAPEVSFSAAEIGCEAFGYNIENRHLVAALERRAAEHAAFARVTDTATSVDLAADGVTIHLGGGGDVRARVAIAADGRNSLLRRAAGIATDQRAYPQTALAFNLRHARPHENIATEFHTRPTVHALVPLPACDPAWSASPIVRRRRRCWRSTMPRWRPRLSGAPIRSWARSRSRRGAFPLEIATAHRFGARRVALIARRRTSSRRSARKVSISGCATPP